jgi:hypothetical protein
MLDFLQRRDECDLVELAQDIRQKVISHYTWERFTSAVWGEIEKVL